jgi:Leucine-rich repeat (LRR) protein
MKKTLMIPGILVLLTLFSCNGTKNNKNSNQNTPFDSTHFLSLPDLYRAERFDNVAEALKSENPVYKFIIFGQDLQEFPDGICELSTLNTLELTRNKLKDLPFCLANLQYLQSLYISKNQFEKMPKAIYDIPNLKRLNVGYNPMKVPNDFDKLSTLDELQLEGLKLNDFPSSVLKMPNLRILDIADNSLTSLPEDIAKLEKLEVLDIAHNQISEFPDGITELKNLKRIDIGKNNFTDEYLNEMRGKMPNVKIK